MMQTRRRHAGAPLTMTEAVREPPLAHDALDNDKGLPACTRRVLVRTFASNDAHARWRSNRNALAITTSVLPSCAMTAGPIPATPLTVATTSTAMTPRET